MCARAVCASTLSVAPAHASQRGLQQGCWGNPILFCKRHGPGATKRFEPPPYRPPNVLSLLRKHLALEACMYAQCHCLWCLHLRHNAGVSRVNGATQSFSAIA
jgi:hypothetical protein